MNEVIPRDALPPTDKEAINAVRRLYRFATKGTLRCKFEITSGRNYTWHRGSTYYVNPNRNGRGWHELLHDISHYLHWSEWAGKKKPHCREHAKLELRLRKEAMRRGWITRRESASSTPTGPTT